jgi:hypothetical protein
VSAVFTERKVPMRLYDGTVEEPGWYFWTDYASVGHGPFASEAEARAAFVKWEDGN